MTKGKGLDLRGGRAAWVNHLEVRRIEQNVLAEPHGRPLRLLVAGHIDTAPPNGNEQGRLEGDPARLGAADMKGGLAVMLELAKSVASPSVDLTYVFYAVEKVEQRASGLSQSRRARPDLLAADAAS